MKRSTAKSEPEPRRSPMADDGVAQCGLRTLAGSNLLGEVYRAEGFVKAEREVRRLAEEGARVNEVQVELQREFGKLELAVREAERHQDTEQDRRAAADARRAVALNRASFGSGARRLQTIGAARAREEQKARSALASTLRRCVEDLGKRQKEIVDVDFAFFLDSPRDSPDELETVHVEAVRISEMANKLSGKRDALNVYWSAMGDVAEVVVDGKLGLMPFAGHDWTRRGRSLEEALPK